MAPSPIADIPARHPGQRADVTPLLALVARLLGVPPPTDAQWQAIGTALTIGDPPVDELVRWMRRVGMGTSRPLFDRAVAGGIDSIADPPGPLRAFFRLTESPPAWVDWERIALGQRTFQRGGADGVYLTRNVPYLGGFAASGINRTLVLTKTGQSGATGGGQRFAESLQWGLDVVGGGLRPGESGYRSTLHVRLIHGLVRGHVAALPQWRPGDWGVPVNQTDMAATMLGALYAPVVASMAMGMIYTPGELDAAAHVARYAGWLMGIEERYLPGSFRDATRQLYYYFMALSSPDETSRQLAQPMAADPLSWHYPHLAPLRRRIAWAQHLSIARAYLGSARMRELGLPTYMPPWYPALKLPVNLTRSGLALALPGGRNRQARSGLRRQRAFVHTLTGPKTAVIGESASYVGRAA
jgi:ER-bound oxygenase mpaB/B'/Rubber oxygenase, catalytic domain